MSTPYVSPYLMQSSQASRSHDHARMTPEEVLADDSLSVAEKSLYLDRMEQDAVAAITIEDEASPALEGSMRPAHLLEVIKTARRELRQSS